MSIMKNLNIKTTEDLTRAVIDDIRYKNLSVGDKYLSAKEVAEKFSVSTVTAHKAMVALAEKNILIRKRKSGTFIGPGFIGDPDLDNDSIHILHVFMTRAYSKNYPTVFNTFSDIAEELLDDCMVEFHMIPERESLQFTKRLINQIENSDYNEAVVLIHSSEKVQKTLQESDIPTVIFGSAFTGIELPSLDLDQEKIGNLVAQALIDKKCSRILLLSYSFWRQGDNLLFNAISQTMGASGYPMGSLIIQNVSQETEYDLSMINSAVQDQNVGIICRDGYMVKNISDSLENDKIPIIGCCDEVDSKHVYAWVKPLKNYRQQVEELLSLLKEKDSSSPARKVDIKLSLKNK